MIAVFESTTPRSELLKDLVLELKTGFVSTVLMSCGMDIHRFGSKCTCCGVPSALSSVMVLGSTRSSESSSTISVGKKLSEKNGQI